MLKFINFLVLLSVFLMLNEKVQGKPEDLQTAALLAAGQIKDTIDNGAAAKDNKEFEIFGAKVKTGMEVGFGDAIKSKRSPSSSESDERRKRSVEQDINGIEKEEEEEDLYDEDYSYSDYSSSSSESEEPKVVAKRSLNLNDLPKFKNSDSFEQFNNDLMNMYLKKK
ncbi:uncharacterized protein LOC111681374 [Lucilia cuprina]|uniref:uncharacterized protein LOC111681374 n=1 Tax=Lucilia cuprina TaxID=7375 RepID=UPI001F063207|nr:uncharacterized protein LOC111681374 [Lucilia cuprina]